MRSFYRGWLHPIQRRQQEMDAERAREGLLTWEVNHKTRSGKSRKRSKKRRASHLFSNASSLAANKCEHLHLELHTHTHTRTAGKDMVNWRIWKKNNRVDDKTASDYALEGGSTLHLVLALRGGQWVAWLCVPSETAIEIFLTCTKMCQEYLLPFLSFRYGHPPISTDRWWDFSEGNK